MATKFPLLSEAYHFDEQTSPRDLQRWCERFIAAQTGDHETLLTVLVGAKKAETLEEFGLQMASVRKQLNRFLKKLEGEQEKRRTIVSQELTAISEAHIRPVESVVLGNAPEGTDTEKIKGISGDYMRCLAYARAIKAKLLAVLPKDDNETRRQTVRPVVAETTEPDNVDIIEFPTPGSAESEKGTDEIARDILDQYRGKKPRA